MSSKSTAVEVIERWVCFWIQGECHEVYASTGMYFKYHPSPCLTISLAQRLNLVGPQFLVPTPVGLNFFFRFSSGRTALFFQTPGRTAAWGFQKKQVYSPFLFLSLMLLVLQPSSQMGRVQKDRNKELKKDINAQIPQCLLWVIPPTTLQLRNSYGSANAVVAWVNNQSCWPSTKGWHQYLFLLFPFEKIIHWISL